MRVIAKRLRPALLPALFALALAAPIAVLGVAPPQVVLAVPGSGGGTSGAIERFTLGFSEAMVPLGDPRAVAPATSDCPVPASGRWIDQTTYVFDFERPLPGGTSCKVTLRPGLAALSGRRIEGLTSYTIDTAGPSVRAVLAPGAQYGEIDEDQVFLVATNVPAAPASVAAQAACAVDGVGETSAVDLLPAGTALEVLDGMGALDWRRRSFLEEAGIAPDLPGDARTRAAALAPVVALKCRRPLPPEREMALLWPKGIVDANGKAAGRDQRFDFTVRAAFTASFECGRVSAKAACNPITPVHLRFSAPVDLAKAMAVRLRLADGSERAPKLPDDSKGNAQVADLDFARPFPASSGATVVLPQDIVDLSGRPLSNAQRFPLAVKFDAAPPLVKFAAGFGIVEAREGAVLPVTVRAVEPSLAGSLTSLGGQRAEVADDDAAIARWLRRLDEAEESDFETIEHKDGTSTSINHTREKPLLTGGGTALSLNLPGKGKDFEVVGLPLAGKGFHVVELKSPALGAALLGRNTPRYVAAGALVTDMAVHFKWGRESSLVWVTGLADAQPVGGAAIRISDSCTGKLLAAGKTDSTGRMAVMGILPPPSTYGGCGEFDEHPLMVSARSGDDMSFTLTSWDKGISPYDFDLSFGGEAPDELIHTVFDRALVKAGETVHFKHVLRRPVGQGFAIGAPIKGTLTFAHAGSDTRFSQAIEIGPGGSALGEWAVPQGAPLGDYDLRITVGEREIWTRQSLRVDEYKLPTMRAALTGPKEVPVQPASVPVQMFAGYLSGGGAPGLPVTLRSQFTDWVQTPRNWERFSFGGEPVTEGTRPLDSEGGSTAPALPYSQTLPATLGADGTARAEIAVSEKLARPVSLLVEMDYPDANGEVLTAARTITLHPAALQVGVRTDGWMMRGDDLRLQTVVLGLDGQPLKGRQVKIELYSREILTARRRLIGGFYAYDNQERVTRLSESCTINTDGTGQGACRLAPGVSGEVTVVASADDGSGRVSRAVTTVWLAGEDDWWFGGDNGDRMDVIAESPEYKAGDTARFQVRMPFREATALVTVEREGVLSSFVTRLSGKDPVVKVKLPGGYAPNVYVSVMAVRGRVSGAKLWWADLAQRWNLPLLSREGANPSATVDLAKPSYRIGMAKVRVGWEQHKLDVAVRADREKYAVRDVAQVGIAVRGPDGKPARSAEVAFVAVDEALLQLKPNTSWDLLGAMMGDRDTAVTTSTAQMQVVGKRHFGKKAVAAGGGGGDASGVNRENFQPVLLWQGRVTLDARGTARVAVPLSDALSRFRLVAVATDGAQLFGTGETTVRTAQDLSIYPGLPSLVRTGDHYDAVFTLRNGSDRAMTVTARPRIEPALKEAPPLTITIPAGKAGVVRWGLDAPQFTGELKWTLEARSADGKAVDSVVAVQEVAPAVPTEVWAASLLRVGDGAGPMIAPPTGALPGGYVSVAFSESLAAPLGGVRTYMADYPYGCFEQRLSRAIVAGDSAGWNALAGAMPTYLDSDGLVRYWPAADAPGSPELTAYVVAATAAAGFPLPEASRARVLAGLKGVVEGRLARSRVYGADERVVRIAALAALARAGAAEPGLVARIDMVPADMPTSALAQWITALDRLPAAPRAAQLRAAAEGELRKRLVYEGTRLDLADASRAPWWMMTSADEMAILALDAVLDKPAWAAEVPRMMAGVAARQQRGHWDTTPANAWGALLSRRFTAAYPASAIAGTTRIALGSQSRELVWPQKDTAPLRLPLVAGPLSLTQSGGAGPWATVSVHAAVPPTQPLSAGYRLSRSIKVISAATPGRYSAGDVIRVRLTIEASAERTWVALSDPLVPGASVLSGLGNQSAALREGEEQQGAAPAYTEASRGSWRAYFDWLPRGTTVVEYTVRLNSAGRFTLPPARAEAMYAPAIRGALPIGPVQVWAR